MNRLRIPHLTVTAKYAFVISIEVTLLLQRLLQAEASSVDPDLRSWQGATADLSRLQSGAAFEIVEDEGGPVVLGKAVDHLPNAVVHFIDNETLVGREIGVVPVDRLIELHDARPVAGLAVVIGRDPRGNREGPRLHTRATSEGRKAADDANQRLLEKIVGESTVANVSGEVTS